MLWDDWNLSNGHLLIIQIELYRALLFIMYIEKILSQEVIKITYLQQLEQGYPVSLFLSHRIFDKLRYSLLLLFKELGLTYDVISR